MEFKIIDVNPTHIPIEYKKLNPEDFAPDYTIKGGKTKIVTPNEDGFIGDKLIAEIDLDEKNTVVINAGVGQGKSTTCISIAKEYYKKHKQNGSKEYTIIFVTPYISILNQYHYLLLKDGTTITSTDVFNYINLNDKNFDVSAPNFKQLHYRV